MQNFDEEYQKLNNRQRQAVDTIDGPLVVRAGPGTGKTQLLSARVAHILAQPDVVPQNLLCLTFTDNAARTMRERLERMIGQAAFHISVQTFHSFGVEIINQYPDFFTERALLQATDELGSYELLRDIFNGLGHDNSLATKVGDEFIFLKDTLSIIGWLKHNALTPAELKATLAANQRFFKQLTPLLEETFADTPATKYLTRYTKLLKHIRSSSHDTPQFGFVAYEQLCADTLEEAITQTAPDGRYAPAMTAWRSQWLEKDSRGHYQFKDAGRALQKMQALADIYQQLQDTLAARGLYDFDDMIIEVVQALENHQDLRLNLQERYQYILVDEFQDTNKAQLRMLQALGDNPVNENRPNIMVVGDDDQAIYAFQGAASSNLHTFEQLYRDVAIIELEDNYRSTQTILDAALGLMGQVERRAELYPQKKLRAQAELPIDLVEQDVFPSELQQYQWLSEAIKTYIAGGTQPSEIAVIAPRHKYLERLMPYLASKHVPVAYERRENILEAPLITQLLKMAELVTAMSGGQHDRVDVLLGEVLSYPFWGLPAETLIETSQYCYDHHVHWLPVLLKHHDKRVVAVVKWFVDTARHATTEPLEYMLDSFIGTTEPLGIDTSDADVQPSKKSKRTFISPLKDFYFNEEQFEHGTDEYLTLLGQLSTLRQRLRAWKPDQALYIADLVEFARLHIEAKLKIIDTNPHTQSTNAVQVMTAYKAKGLEFDIVFVINAQDEVWGPSARSRAERIRLPKNVPIKPAGDSDDDKLRLFYVALTRTRHSLHITSYSHNLDNKLSAGLSFIGGNTADSEVVHPAFKPRLLKPAPNAEAVRILTTDWAYRYRQVIADKPVLFEPMLARYQLSVTHLNNFIDTVNAGPQYFLTHNFLHFPEAISSNAAYGDAVHKTLQWLYAELRKDNGNLPKTSAIIDYFKDILQRKHLPPAEATRFLARGEQALRRYLKAQAKSFDTSDIIERGFANEGVVIAEARLSGKIDKLVPQTGNTFTVIDFKTGQAARSWQSQDEYEKLKLHKYAQQLMFYKLLVEHSASYGAHYSVSEGALEFIEADRSGDLVEPLKLGFDLKNLARFEQLISAVWRHIMELNFPDISSYSPNFKGVQAFEQDLLDGKV